MNHVFARADESLRQLSSRSHAPAWAWEREAWHSFVWYAVFVRYEDLTRKNVMLMAFSTHYASALDGTVKNVIFML